MASLSSSRKAVAWAARRTRTRRQEEEALIPARFLMN